MFCSQCGTANADGAQFCSKCGAALSTAPASSNPAPAVPGAVQPAICPAQSSGKALASLVFGLFFFVFPAAVVAIVFGHLSLSEIRKSAGHFVASFTQRSNAAYFSGVKSALNFARSPGCTLKERTKRG